MVATSPRFRVRVIGIKHDYIRRYKVIDTQSPAHLNPRVDGVPGGLVKSEAEGLAETLNVRYGRRF